MKTDKGRKRLVVFLFLVDPCCILFHVEGYRKGAMYGWLILNEPSSSVQTYGNRDTNERGV
jgi:hypothetical protein